MVFSVCVVLLVTVWQASAQAPGDEDQRCLNERAQANDVYPPSTRMLMDSRNYEELISGSRPHWKQLDVDGTGFGWTSTLGGLCAYEARVCDFRESTSQENWVFTQYISYLQAREVFVNISAGFIECRLAQNPRCNQLYVDMYRYERNGRNDAAARTTSNYQLIQRVQQPNGFAQRTYRTSFTFNPSGNTNGFYVGIRATGTCLNIQRLQIYYNEFMLNVDPPVKCPRTGLPPQGTTASVTCSCSANSVATSDLQLTCNSDGKCIGTPSCQCRGGYRLQEEHCKACPAGTYHSHSDPVNSCMPCPAYTNVSGVAVTTCPCIAGYFRTAQEGPSVGCTQPPTAVRNLRVTSKTNTSITIQWYPPQEIGRSDYYYSVEYSDLTDISRYTQHNQNKITNTIYSVTGLQPITTYTIRISVHNGVSGNDSQNDDKRRRQVNDTTLEGIPSASSRVQGLCTIAVIMWSEPLQTNGRLTGYDLRFYNVYYENIVFQAGDEIFRIVKETDVPSHHGSTFVQVRGRTRAGAGNWSEAVSLGCSEPTGTTTPGEALTSPPVVTRPLTPAVTCPPTPPPVTCPPVVTCPSVVEYPSVPCPTPLPATPPSPPAQISCVDVFYDEDERTKLVLWDKPLGEVTVYSVRISYIDGSSGLLMNQHRSSKNQWIKLHLISLPMERPLWIEVRAHNSGGTAHWSSRVELSN